MPGSPLKALPEAVLFRAGTTGRVSLLVDLSSAVSNSRKALLQDLLACVAVIYE
jgi:hypothetical protein